MRSLVSNSHTSEQNAYDAKKKSPVLCKKNLFLVVQLKVYFFYSRTKTRVIVISDSNYKKETSGLCRITLIVIKYEKHPLFGQALDKNEPSTARPKKESLFCTAKVILSVDLLF